MIHTQIVGGTGIAPAHQLLSSCFSKSDTDRDAKVPRFKLLYAAPTIESLSLLPELRRLQHRAQDKLDVQLLVESDTDTTALSRIRKLVGMDNVVQAHGLPVTVGRRIRPADLKAQLSSVVSRRAILVCGPEPMVATIAGPRKLDIIGLDGKPVGGVRSKTPLGGYLGGIRGVRPEQVFRL